MISINKTKQFADRNSIKFFETSAKLSTNLFEIFKTLAFDIFNWNDMMKVGLFLNYYIMITQEKNYLNNNNQMNNPIKSHEKFAFNYNMPQDIVLRNTLQLKTKKTHKLNPFKKKVKIDNNINSKASNTLSNNMLSLSLNSLSNFKNSLKFDRSKLEKKSKSKEKSSSRLNLKIIDKNKLKLDHGCCKIS